MQHESAFSLISPYVFTGSSPAGPSKKENTAMPCFSLCDRGFRTLGKSVFSPYKVLFHHFFRAFCNTDATRKSAAPVPYDQQPAGRFRRTTLKALPSHRSGSRRLQEARQWQDRTFCRPLRSRRSPFCRRRQSSTSVFSEDLPSQG